MTPVVPRFLSAAISDQGSVRQNNEDRVYCDDVRGFFFVVDGMGGHQAGEQAAQIATDRISARLERQTGTAEQRLREAITLANNAVYEAAERTPAWKGMSCVVTAAVIESGSVTIGHVGDSRLYKIRHGRIEKVTRDHSPVGEREDRGELSETDAMQHPRRHEVYRDVGSEGRTPDLEDFIDIQRISFEADSALLLCSDGLSDALSSREILQVVAEHAGDRQTIVRRLVADAARVGKDNISAIFIEGDEFAQSAGTRSLNSEVRASSESSWKNAGRLRIAAGTILGVLFGFALRGWITPAELVIAPRQAIVVSAPGTIAAALERAQAGDTVSIAPGSYAEPVHLKSGVGLLAQQPYASVLSGPVTADGVKGARLEGFLIQSTAPIRITDSDVILARNRITGARATAVDFIGTSAGSMFACNVHDNAGAGIVIGDSASPVIENNVIARNGLDPLARRPGLFNRSTGRPRIAGNSFADNGAEAMWLPGPDEDLIKRNFFIPPTKPDRRAKFRAIPLGVQP